jgi:hypothetical protein
MPSSPSNSAFTLNGLQKPAAQIDQPFDEIWSKIAYVAPQVLCCLSD